jgi:dipeptidase E
MKLVFYSGGRTKKNHTLHQGLFDLANKGRKKKSFKSLSFTYIPFCKDDSESFFMRAVARYEPFGFKHFQSLKVDEPFSKGALQQALESDVIYLAGGNTFYFLKHLRKSGFLTSLREYAERGGVVAGLSAGGLILTPSIGLAAYPKFDADKNEVGLKDLRALNLTQFEFFPHYENTPRYDRALSLYSLKTKNPLFAVKDGGGIIVDGATTTCLGKTVLFSQGLRIPLSG